MGAHLLRPRLPAASAASSRATASPHRTTVLAVLLPAYSTATRRSVAGRAPCGRGRRTPSASARGQRSTTSAWIAPTCVVSVVSLYQAGGPSTARGIAGSPRKQDDEATTAHKGPAAIVCSSRRKTLACGVISGSHRGGTRTMIPREVCSPKSGPPRRGPGPHKDALVFIRHTAPDLVGPNIEGPTATPRHAGPVPRLGDPAVSAVPAPHKLDIPRSLGPQVTPGPNGGHYFAPWPR